MKKTAIHFNQKAKNELQKIYNQRNDLVEKIETTTNGVIDRLKLPPTKIATYSNFLDMAKENNPMNLSSEKFFELHEVDLVSIKNMFAALDKLNKMLPAAEMPEDDFFTTYAETPSEQKRYKLAKKALTTSIEVLEASQEFASLPGGFLVRKCAMLAEGMHPFLIYNPFSLEKYKIEVNIDFIKQ